MVRKAESARSEVISWRSREITCLWRSTLERDRRPVAADDWRKLLLLDLSSSSLVKHLESAYIMTLPSSCTFARNVDKSCTVGTRGATNSESELRECVIMKIFLLGLVSGNRAAKRK
jgi:hypothetical protein